MVRDHVLPSAVPGIMTGTILALSRAIGETAPLLMLGRGRCHLRPAEGAIEHVHGPAGRDLHLREGRRGSPAIDRRRRHPAATHPPADDELRRDRDPQPLSDALAMKPETESHNMPIANAAGPAAPAQEAKTMSLGEPPQPHRRVARRQRPVGPQALGLVRHVARRAGSVNRHPPQQDHRADRPLGLRQEHAPALLQPHERPDPGRPHGGGDPLRGHGPDRPQTPTPWPSAAASAWSSRSRIPFPKSIYQNVAWGARINGYRGRHGRARRDVPAPRGPVGRGQEQAPSPRLRPLRRPAAAPLHRPHARRRARGHPDGRALLGARPDRHREGRGPDGRAEERLHDRDRHPQHAAGPPHQRHDRLPHARRLRPTERPSHGRDRRVQPHRAPLHQPARPPHRGLHHGRIG